MADRIQIDTEVLNAVSKKLGSLSSELSSCQAKVSRIASDIDAKSGAKVNVGQYIQLSLAGMRAGGGNIQSCLQQYARALNRYEDLASKLASKTSSALRHIENQEKSLCDVITQIGSDSPFSQNGGGNAGEGSGGGGAPDKGLILPGWDKILLDSIGKAGSIGAFIKTIFGMVNSGGSWDSIAKFLVRGGDMAAKWAKNFSKYGKMGKDFWKSMTGLTPYLSDPSKLSGIKGFGENLSSGLKKGFSSVATWLTAGITSAKNNYEEFGGQITDRAVVEWATETAAEVGLKVGTTALVGAAVTAAGVASAPALAIGIAGTLVYTGIDCLWKNTIGNGDGIVESIGHGVGEMYDGAKAWIGDTWGKITNGFKISAIWA